MPDETQSAEKIRKTTEAGSIKDAIQQDDWPTARRLIRAALRREPDSHWLLTRLGLTYYEQYDYERALFYSRQAHKLAPRCPLVLWDLAGAYEMLKRLTESQKIFRLLISRGISAIAFDTCGEGVAWARGLIADCWYRIAHIEHRRGRRARAIASFRRHLALRGPGCRSIYPISQVRRELRALLSKVA
jgi:tetratricopeptide (TPR) repeat protein